MFIRHALTLIVALATSAITLSPCYAQTSTATVRYADLNLSSPAGAAVLKQRIKAAAWKVCDNGSSDLASRMASRKCRRSAEQSATTQVASLFPVRTASR